jgi:SAM-dependent methyltransferase
MTQNIYDNPEFFENYGRLPRSIEGLAGAPEWPALQALLPELGGRRVVDLGCGFGWFCDWARRQGASHILGIDVSEKMLARARADASDAAITYVRGDLECVALPEASFDVAYSSLAFHYIEDLQGLLFRVHAALVPGGSLVFSVEHPIVTAPLRPGWLQDAAGHKTWPLDSYQIEGPRQTNWLTKGVVKQHRTLGTQINLLLGAGFSMSHLQEWGPTNEQIRAQPQLAEERQRPMFLLVSARR